jgi:hypothetical protein
MRDFDRVDNVAFSENPSCGCAPYVDSFGMGDEKPNIAFRKGTAHSFDR